MTLVLFTTNGTNGAAWTANSTPDKAFVNELRGEGWGEVNVVFFPVLGIRLDST